MSSDTAKENASVVDSSVTEKHDVGNSDDPESSSYKANEHRCPSLAKEAKAGHSNGQLENSTDNKKGKLYNTRYFIIKSLNHQNIQLSIEKEIWATQVMNEPILEEAFHSSAPVLQNSGKVILIFSVNMSGFFQGYAQMMSSVGWRRDNVWSQGNGKNNPWGRSFKVKWLRLNTLPFQKTLHLKNPLNDYKPVKISRDCQELPQDIGEALCDLLDGKDDVDGIQTSFHRDDLPAKRPCIEPSCSLGDEEYHKPPLHVPLGKTPMPYPSFLYQHQDSPLASTITEDDFLEMVLVPVFSNLEMSYEEYLEAHSRSIKQLCHPVGGPSWSMWESSSKKQDNDSNSSFVMDKRHTRKRTHQSSQK
ncbi:uncharacterized protein LOC102622363 isoform X10 [Citrus sinensis]|uniref:uncharacterized protein LOC102622363 isoform X10 n=1 Tax=Citrus sinensis TaxID=2711 RepID=UPI002278233D|nr:uncharacterized protein LOC102622363 isoform X10 [Citrus sinensis]